MNPPPPHNFCLHSKRTKSMTASKPLIAIVEGSPQSALDCSKQSLGHIHSKKYITGAFMPFVKCQLIRNPLKLNFGQYEYFVRFSYGVFYYQSQANLYAYHWISLQGGRTLLYLYCWINLQGCYIMLTCSVYAYKELTYYAQKGSNILSCTRLTDPLHSKMIYCPVLCQPIQCNVGLLMKNACTHQ